MRTPETPERQPRIYEALEPTLRKVCEFVRPPKQQPPCDVTTMFTRAHYFEEMVELAAKLETLRALEDQYRAQTVAALGRLSYAATECQFRLETRQWLMSAGMFELEFQAAEQACTKHREQIMEIQRIEHELADMQATLDDPECWTEEATAQLIARFARKQKWEDETIQYLAQYKQEGPTNA